jgi:hypothetical protein
MSKSKQPNCLHEIFRELEKKPENIYEETPGGYRRNFRVIVERLENVSEIDEKAGVKWAWSRCACGRGCDSKAYVRFRPGNVTKSVKGSMEPGKTYAVEGGTMLDAYGNLIITNL